MEMSEIILRLTASLEDNFKGNRKYQFILNEECHQALGKNLIGLISDVNGNVIVDDCNIPNFVFSDITFIKGEK